MNLNNRKNFYIVITLLVLVEITSVFLMCKSLSDKPTLDNVKLKEIDNKDTFAIMLGDKDGVYTESDSNTWPSNKSYTYNSERSGCIDKDGNKIDNALTFNSETNIATVSVSQTAYCYLYFDIDSVEPQAFTFYLGGSTNPTYSTSTSTTAYLSWTDTDITEVCITNTQGSSNCTWQSVTGTSTTVSHTLTSGDATKTVYAYLKDEAGNISSEVTDTIILDTTKPTISSVTKTSDDQTSISITVSASDTNNIKTYYYSINNGTYTSSTSNTNTFTGLTAGTSYTISVYVIDNAGNQSATNTQTFSTAERLTASEGIQALAPSGYNSTMEGGLYRFQGTDVNNYICFGTSDKSTCTGNTDAYMYRIIGINSSGQLKLIKNEALNSTMTWYSNYTSNIAWPSSTMYSNINGSYFLTNTTYVPSGWSDKIATTTWKYGDNTTDNTTAANLYSTENGWTNATSAKIGLMYMHDYYYAYQSGGLNCSSSGSYTTCVNAWMHLSKCDSGAPSTYEWSMSRYGYYSASSGYYAWSVNSNGRAYINFLTHSGAVRPAFYLTSDVQFISGTGTSTDPFILE